MGQTARRLHLPERQGVAYHRNGPLRPNASLCCFKIRLHTCTLKMKCCPNTPASQVPRDINEYARDVARSLMRTKAFVKSRDERKRVEMRFAQLKVHH